MKRMRIWLCVALWWSAAAAAQTSADFPAQSNVDDLVLIKNGEGDRLYGLLRIKVYRAALYLPRRNASDTAILKMGSPRVIRMRYFHGAARDDARRAWRVYLEKNCTSPCVWPAPGTEGFLALVGMIEAGDQETYVFRHDGVEISRNGKSLGRIEAPDFSRLLLSTWIGATPTTAALKRDLLGR